MTRIPAHIYRFMGIRRKDDRSFLWKDAQDVLTCLLGIGVMLVFGMAFWLVIL